MVNKRGRDSENGQFIPVEEANRRPKTTQVETIKPQQKPAPPKPNKPKAK